MALPFLVALAFLTAILSGVLGMAGGLALMGACTLLLPVASAMVFHGATQLVANGSRALTLLPHVRGRILLAQGAGSAGAWLLLRLVRFEPDPAFVLIALGLVPMIGVLLPRTRWIDASQPASAVLCGVVTTGVQLVAGVAGPLLDVFYVNSPLDRREVVATKAATQVIAHGGKILFYAPLLAGDARFHPAWLALSGAAAVGGTWLGTRLLDRWSDAGFRSATRWVVLALGAVFLARGVLSLEPLPITCHAAACRAELSASPEGEPSTCSGPSSLPPSSSPSPPPRTPPSTSTRGASPSTVPTASTSPPTGRR